MATPRLTCHVDEAPSVSILHPSGEVDLSTIATLRHALATAFSQGRHVIVDLADVTYIDSTGFRELLAHHRIYRGNDRHMVLANPNQPTQGFLDKLDVDQAIPVFSSIESAQNSLRRRRIR